MAILALSRTVIELEASPPAAEHPARIASTPADHCRIVHLLFAGREIERLMVEGSTTADLVEILVSRA
jgi:hypothetical protein